MSSPRFIFKIVPRDHNAPLPLKALPVQPGEPALRKTSLAPSFRLPSSALDARDGFVHASKAAQVPRTLAKFFACSGADKRSVYLFRVDYDTVTGARAGVEVRWESPDGRTGEAWSEDLTLFPHLYLNQGGRLPVFGGGDGEPDVVVPESVVEVVSEHGEEGWDGALSRIGDWLS